MSNTNLNPIPTQKQSLFTINVRTLVIGAMIAALYTALNIIFLPISFGPIQFRVAEGLTLLPALIPASIPGLFVGCILSNIIGGYGIIDVLIGSTVTLIAAIMTWRLKKHLWMAPIPPVLLNTIVVGSYLWLLFDKTYPYLLTLLYFGLGETGACLIGFPVLLFILKNKSLKKEMGIQ